MNDSSILPLRPDSLTLALPEDATYDQWIEAGKALSNFEKRVQWLIGDWWAFGSRRWGDGEEHANAAGLNYGTCRNAASVSRSFELSRRRDNVSWSAHREVAPLEPEQQDEILDSNPTQRQAREAARTIRNADPLPPRQNGERHAVHYSSETPEHYTPERVIERVLKVFERPGLPEGISSIDLDPCSDPNFNVPATAHYTKEHDGLSREWRGTVYMNPPYGREIDEWSAKLIAEHEAGRTSEAIALMPARTDTDWFMRFERYPVCFVHGRLRFIGNEQSAPFPSAVFYLGERVDVFARVFCELGTVYNVRRRYVYHG